MQHFGLVLLLAGVVGVMTATNTDPVCVLDCGRGADRGRVLLARWPGGDGHLVPTRRRRASNRQRCRFFVCQKVGEYRRGIVLNTY